MQLNQIPLRLFIKYGNIQLYIKLFFGGGALRLRPGVY